MNAEHKPRNKTWGWFYANSLTGGLRKSFFNSVSAPYILKALLRGSTYSELRFALFSKFRSVHRENSDVRLGQALFKRVFLNGGEGQSGATAVELYRLNETVIVSLLLDKFGSESYRRSSRSRHQEHTQETESS